MSEHDRPTARAPDASRAENLGLPKTTAAQGLYALTLLHGTARVDVKAREPDPAMRTWAGEWLGNPLGDAVSDVLAARKRIVQETIGTELLQTTNLQDWF